MVPPTHVGRSMPFNVCSLCALVTSHFKGNSRHAGGSLKGFLDLQVLFATQNASSTPSFYEMVS